MTRNLATAPALLKMRGINPPVSLHSVLRKFVDNKGFDHGVVIELAQRGVFGLLLDQLVLQRTANEESEAILWNHFAANLRFAARTGAIQDYRGSVAQNIQVDRALYVSHNPATKFVGEGAGSSFPVPISLTGNIDAKALRVPIGIIGYGAAGILIGNALRRMGFINLTIFEKRDAIGIWSQKNVVQGTRNNPRRIDALGYALHPAPGGGDEVGSFLRQLIVHKHVEGEVVEVIPGQLHHEVRVKNAKGAIEAHAFPILVNAIGIGKPRDFTDPTKMRGNETHLPAVRWQQPQLTTAQANKKRFVFVGLGNSTAEMIRQLHKFEDSGLEIDYRIVTHYPRDAVFNPQEEVEEKGVKYRVFRDTSKPNLTAFQGDLPDARKDYYRALLSGRIVSEVSQWRGTRQHFGMFSRKRGSPVEEVAYDSLYVLTGYEHDEETFHRMGLPYDEQGRCALYDYDGEFQDHDYGGNAGAERLLTGYFGLGAILDAPWNRNSLVIPGMVFRMPDVLFGIVMRAAEHARNNP